MIRSLHVDIEGGRGGSSRSLYQLLSRLDRSRFEPFVAHRQQGPLEEWYRLQNIRTVHIPDRIVCTAPSEQCEDFRGELAETIAHPPGRGSSCRPRAERTHQSDPSKLRRFVLARRLPQKAYRPTNSLSRSGASAGKSGGGKWLVNRLSKRGPSLVYFSNGRGTGTQASNAALG